jgi:hypothetical protein
MVNKNQAGRSLEPKVPLSFGAQNREVSSERLAAESATTRALRLDGCPCIMCLTNMSRLRHQLCDSCYYTITDFHYPSTHITMSCMTNHA